MLAAGNCFTGSLAFFYDEATLCDISADRIIRLEMRLRYFQLYGKKFEPVEAKLSFRQIAALRFSSDEELPALLERTIEENLSPRSIKKLITEWRPEPYARLIRIFIFK